LGPIEELGPIDKLDPVEVLDPIDKLDAVEVLDPIDELASSTQPSSRPLTPSPNVLFLLSRIMKRRRRRRS
jgi:hypothetical protein